MVMESSHDSEPGCHADLYREQMDTVILKSTLYDYEPLLLHDGCTGCELCYKICPDYCFEVFRGGAEARA